jgi:hypothetical protein
MRQPHTGLLSPTSKISTSKAVDALHEAPTVEPPVVLRHHSEHADCHEISPFNSSCQGAQNSTSERNSDGKKLTYYHS